MTKPQTDATPEALPKVVVFDLDYTLWPLWVDTHVDSPIKRKGNDINKAYDRHNESMCFYKDVPEILLQIHQSKIYLAAASRTPTPNVARQALDALYIPYSTNLSDPSKQAVPAAKLFNQMEIYPSSKLKHFQMIHEKSGIPYDQMVFFDDESRNKEVEVKLGVTFVYVPNGMTNEVFEKGLHMWRSRQKL